MCGMLQDFSFLLLLGKFDQLLEDAENTKNMTNQLLYRTFKDQQGCSETALPTGPKVSFTNSVLFQRDKRQFSEHSSVAKHCQKSPCLF